MKYCLIILLLLNQFAAVVVAQLDFHDLEDIVVATNPIQWSGALAIGADSQIMQLAYPGGNVIFNLERNSTSATTKLFTGDFFGEKVVTGNLGTSRTNHYFLQLRHEQEFPDSKWTGYFQGDLDLTNYFSRFSANGGIGFNAYRSDKSELKFRVGAGATTAESNRYYSGTSSGFQFQFGGNWAFQMTERCQIYGDVDYFLPLDRQPYFALDPLLLNLGVDFFVSKSPRIGIRTFITNRFGNASESRTTAYYGLSFVTRF